ncbi:MAG: hypothetical protein EBR82_89095 [Caulobacteraceae bacterium]|nr:hypothetical protein [Caulobacteraceae bacterium]
MSKPINFDHVPDRRPHVYTVGLDGTDQPLPITSEENVAVPITSELPTLEHRIGQQYLDVAKDFPTGDDDLEVRVTSIVVAPKGAEIFEPGVTRIAIEDCAAGEYVTLKQLHYQVEQSSIEIEPDHWPVLRQAIEWMLGQCRA